MRSGLLHDLVTDPATHPDLLPGDRRVVARVFALTDVGQIREHNEDAFVVADLETGTPLDFGDGYHEITADPHGLLFLVADGMGGAASGELASSMAGTLVLDTLRRGWQASHPSAAAFAEALRDATALANSRIHQFARENPEHRGMGTTATIVGLLGDRLFLAQVGDSRAYLVRDGQVQQLTKDQSLMQRLVDAGELTAEQAEVSERRNIILQALGPEAQITVDLTHQQIRRGDTLIVCSDGLSGLVRAPELVAVAREERDVRAMCTRLVGRANALGGHDNITVIAARFDGTALEPTVSSDTFGYNTLPLAGTLNEDVPATPPPEQRATLRSDPTPRFGTPAVSRAVLAAEFAAAQAAAQAAVPTPLAAHAVPAPVVDARRRAARPLNMLLAVVAIAAVVWLVYDLLPGTR